MVETEIGGLGHPRGSSVGKTWISAASKQREELAGQCRRLTESTDEIFSLSHIAAGIVILYFLQTTNRQAGEAAKTTGATDGDCAAVYQKLSATQAND